MFDQIYFEAIYVAVPRYRNLILAVSAWVLLSVTTRRRLIRENHILVYSKYNPDDILNLESLGDVLFCVKPDHRDLLIKEVCFTVARRLESSDVLEGDFENPQCLLDKIAKVIHGADEDLGKLLNQIDNVDLQGGSDC